MFDSVISDKNQALKKASRSSDGEQKYNVVYRDGMASDYDEIKRISNSKNNRKALPFVMRVTIESAASEQSERKELSRSYFKVADIDGKVVGWIRAYHRNDNRTTLHEVCVDEQFQNMGIGTALVKGLIERASFIGNTGIALSTPEDLNIDDWYSRLGFKLWSKKDGKKRMLNVYYMPLTYNHHGSI